MATTSSSSIAAASTANGSADILSLSDSEAQLGGLCHRLYLHEKAMKEVRYFRSPNLKDIKAEIDQVTGHLNVLKDINLGNPRRFAAWMWQPKLI